MFNNIQNVYVFIKFKKQYIIEIRYNHLKKTPAFASQIMTPTHWLSKSCFPNAIVHRDKSTKVFYFPLLTYA